STPTRRRCRGARDAPRGCAGPASPTPDRRCFGEEPPMTRHGFPPRQGLYDPAQERDACGVGFVANIRGEKSHELIHQGIQVLERLEHRGACGCDPETGDGAGILIQMPDRFLRQEAAKLGFELPAPGAYASGMIFLARDDAARARQQALFEEIVAAEGQRFLAWRDVPVRPEKIGRIAREAMPAIRQAFVAAGDGVGEEAFARKLYVIRRVFENRVEASGAFCYVPSLSPHTFVFTGMLMSTQIEPFYPDLVDPALESALALAHSRYSTNTFPSWDLAQPFRYMAH